jgi:hypothetical protein
MKSDGIGHDRGSAFGDVSLDLRLEIKRRSVRVIVDDIELDVNTG